MAAIRLLTEPLPFSSSTRRLTSLQCGAMPQIAVEPRLLILDVLRVLLQIPRHRNRPLALRRVRAARAIRRR